MISKEFIKKMLANVDTVKVRLYEDQDLYDFTIWSPSKVDELNSSYEVENIYQATLPLAQMADLKC